MYNFNKEFSYDNILSPNEVKEKGILEDDRFTFEDDYSVQISYTDDNNVTAPFTGLSYWLYPNGNMHGYAFYKNGFKDGDEVEFYENGSISKYTYSNVAEARALFIEWSEDGTVTRIEEQFNAEIRQKRIKYDINGNIIARYDAGKEFSELCRCEFLPTA